MNKIHKVDPTNVSALEDTVSDDVLAQVIASRQLKKDRAAKLGGEVQSFIDWTKEHGYSTPEEFLTLSGFIKTEPAKRTRTFVDPLKRAAIVEASKAGKTTPQIVSEFGIKADLLYSIRKKAGLAAPRKTKVTTTIPAESVPMVPTIEKAAA